MYGKRECDCEQKKNAAEEIAKELSPKEKEAGAGTLVNALNECVPTQSGLQLFGLPAEFQTCSVAPVKGGLILPFLTEHHNSECPTRTALDEDNCPFWDPLPTYGFALDIGFTFA